MGDIKYGNHTGATLAGDWQTITPDEPINPPAFGIWVGTGGDIVVQTDPSRSGNIVTLKNVPSGAPLPCIVYMVLTTNPNDSSTTTATDLVALH
jgi:hypothetical protein